MLKVLNNANPPYKEIPQRWSMCFKTCLQLCEFWFMRCLQEQILAWNETALLTQLHSDEAGSLQQQYNSLLYAFYVHATFLPMPLRAASATPQFLASTRHGYMWLECYTSGNHTATSMKVQPNTRLPEPETDCKTGNYTTRQITMYINQKQTRCHGQSATKFKSEIIIEVPRKVTKFNIELRSVKSA
jgi:hypothetical protein